MRCFRSGLLSIQEPTRKSTYSMNGQTGKVAGILPLDRKKLLRDAVLAGLGVAAVLLMIGGLLI